MEIGKKPVFVEKFRINAQIVAHQVELVELLTKRFEYIIRFGNFALAPLNDKLLELFLPILRRQKQKCCIEVRLEIHTARKETAAFRIHPPRYNVRKSICRFVCGGRNALCLKVERKARLHRRDRRLHPICNHRKLFLHRGIQIGTAIAPRGEE